MDPSIPNRLHDAMEQPARKPPHETYEVQPAPIGFNGRFQVFKDGAGNAIVMFEGVPLSDFIASKVLKEGCNGREVLGDMEFIL